MTEYSKKIMALIREREEWSEEQWNAHLKAQAQGRIERHEHYLQRHPDMKIRNESIYDLWQQGARQITIAEACGISASRVRQIIHQEASRRLIVAIAESNT